VGLEHRLAGFFFKREYLVWENSFKINKGVRSMNKSLDRILDANLNRAREGLRVAEELARLGLEDAVLQRRLKVLRHGITAAEKNLATGRPLILSRAAARDPGNRSQFKFEKKRGLTADLVQANLRRCQEALRVLEEISAMRKAGAGMRFKRLRFQAYDLERDFIERLISLKRDKELLSGRKKKI